VIVGAPKGNWMIGTIVQLIAARLLTRFGKQQLVGHLTDSTHDDLVTLSDLVEAGSVTPVIDRGYPLPEVSDAIRYLETLRARGKVVITV